MVSNDDEEELVKAEKSAADSIINAFQELVDRRNKLTERVGYLEQELSQIKNTR